MLNSRPWKKFPAKMHYFAKSAMKVTMITPISTNDERYKQVAVLIRAGNWTGLLRYTGNLNREVRIAIGKNPEMKAIIRNSSFNNTKRAMARAIFFIPKRV
jgi:hypothetical protein